MIPLSTLRELFNYNYWARDRQLQACALLSPEEFLRPMGNSFSSVRDTLAHLLGAEWVWLERWQGRSPRSLVPAEEFLAVADLQERWRTVEKSMKEYIGGLGEDALTRPLHYTNFKGENWTYPLWRTLLHLVNHQTYHRGQITTLLRQLGKQPTSTDLLLAHDLKWD